MTIRWIDRRAIDFILLVGIETKSSAITRKRRNLCTIPDVTVAVVNGRAKGLTMAV
jgi:hypothetical protein